MTMRPQPGRVDERAVVTPPPRRSFGANLPVLGKLSLHRRGDLIALDGGESNWLEGALVMLVYLLLAVSFFEFV